ncbi:NUDIX domain-containing protein [Caldibacillus lycopersici]|uniref:NUDIX domain-containing protein n=1 Tax=Perspicuibacillus lycopersici TaxID=1325689 RepID=A0AAE3IZM7_9BACI|nr:NUDIX domain-containing protein [Perspicuibacillus lycopersici]MCU9614985.1 NUDIX domain-containing protein [Perspicuibacillus lycopersici]
MNTYRFGAHAIILNAEGQVLLLKRTYGNKGWSTPGGGIEPGETIHDALIRECIEELGVEVKDPILTGVYYHSNVQSQVAMFRCFLPKGKEIKLSEEHSEYKWFPLEQLGEIQRIRVNDAMEYNGRVISRSF